MNIRHIAHRIAKQSSDSDDSKIERIAIFDFDGTIFASPDSKPDWWTEKGLWGNLASLSPPYIPELPGDEWYSAEIVSKAKQCINDPSTFACLLTGRIPAFKNRIEELLNHKGIHFHENYFTSGMATLPYKLSIIEKLAQRFPGAKIEMWDDRDEHKGHFENAILSLGRKGEVHPVKKISREFLNPNE